MTKHPSPTAPNGHGAPSPRPCCVATAGLFLALPSCAGVATPDRNEVEQAQSPVVYGHDDRTNLYDVMDPALAELARTSGVALVPANSLIEGTETVTLSGEPLGGLDRLCAGQAFVDEPSIALCAGLLVSNDLVLTAGHCPLHVSCDEMRFVTGFFYDAPGALHPLKPGDVYRCKEVVAATKSSPTDAERLDYAWIRLDHAVAGFTSPVGLRPSNEPLERGDSLVMFGFPAGLPLKIDIGGVVTDPRTASLDYFVSNTDSFHGGSGSPIFDSSLRLVGIQNRGAADYADAGGCNEVARRDAAPESAEEDATYASRAVDGLCARATDVAWCPARDEPREGSSCTVAAGTAKAPRTGAAIAGLLLPIMASVRKRLSTRRSS